MNVQIEAGWKKILESEFNKPYFLQIVHFLKTEKNIGKIIYPPGSQIFNAFNMSPFEKTKLVLLGQDPYHGPGQAHVEARGGKATIVAFSELGPAKTLDACLRCHGQTLARANIRRSVHTQEDVVCTNCHSIHKSPAPKFLLAKRQTDLCYSCHSTVRAQFAMPFKHRVNEGVVECTDCHNPHGAFAPTTRMASRPRMVDQAEGFDVHIVSLDEQDK